MHWVLYRGRSQAIYPWHTLVFPARKPPKVWFHDLFDGDHKAYDPEEVELIRRLTNDKA